MSRITNFLLVGCVFLFRLWRGVATVKPPVVRTIAVVQGAKLGDMVCTTPVFRAIKEKIPDMRVLVVGSRLNRELLEHSEDVDEYLVYEGNVFKMWRKLRNYKIDAACLVVPDAFLLSLLYLLGVPLIVTPRLEGGEGQSETFSYKKVQKFVKEVPHYMGYYVPREYLRVLEPLGITSDRVEKHLGYSKRAVERVERFFKEQSIDSNDFIIAISPSAGNKLKNWPASRFAQVIEHLSSTYQAKIILIGSSADKDAVLATLRHLKNPEMVINACELFSIDELKAFISKLDLFIAVDTGPIYIAEAFKVPTVDILGPVSEKEQPPQGFYHRNVMIEREHAAMPIMNIGMFDEASIRRQIEEITTPMVIKEIDGLIRDIKETNSSQSFK